MNLRKEYQWCGQASECGGDADTARAGESDRCRSLAWTPEAPSIIFHHEGQISLFRVKFPVDAKSA